MVFNANSVIYPDVDEDLITIKKVVIMLNYQYHKCFGVN